MTKGDNDESEPKDILPSVAAPISGTTPEPHDYVGLVGAPGISSCVSCPHCSKSIRLNWLSERAVYLEQA